MGTAAETEKKPGPKPLDVERICSVCGADVVRPGVLRPVPLCTRHYFEARRRAAGVQPRAEPKTTVADAVSVLRDCRSALSQLVEHYTDDDGMQPVAERLHALALRCETTITGLARAYPTVRGSTAKKGAEQ